MENKSFSCPYQNVEGVSKEWKGKEKEDYMEDRVRDLLEGQNRLVNVGNIPNGTPPWFDKEKFADGRDFVKKYYGGIFFAHLISLTAMLFSPQVLKPLIFTGKSETPKKSYQRYIRTTLHVMNWYFGDIWETDSKARRSLQLVRQYHSDAATHLNSPAVRPFVDKVDISHCGETVHQDQSLIQALQEDLSSVPDCPFLSSLNENYFYFKKESHTSIPYINQVSFKITAKSVRLLNFLFVLAGYELNPVCLHGTNRTLSGKIRYCSSYG